MEIDKKIKHHTELIRNDSINFRNSCTHRQTHTQMWFAQANSLKCTTKMKHYFDCGNSIHLISAPLSLPPEGRRHEHLLEKLKV